MTYTIPDKPDISCIECLQKMHIEMSMMDDYTDNGFIAASCSCGRFIGVISMMAMRRNSKLDRRQIQLMPPDDIAEFGKEMRDHAQERMKRAEKIIAAATWAREKP